MLQNKFQIWQTVVVMHNKKLVEMVVVGIKPGHKRGLCYSLKYTSKLPKVKKIKEGNLQPLGNWPYNSYDKLIATVNRQIAHTYQLNRYGCNVRRANPDYIILDDLDKAPKILETSHDYNEWQIFANKVDFIKSVELETLYVPKPKKEKKTA
jgi:hypothetical protein